MLDFPARRFSRRRMSNAVDRREQIFDDIAKAARIARRDPGDVQLIAVSKGRSAGDIQDA